MQKKRKKTPKVDSAGKQLHKLGWCNTGHHKECWEETTNLRCSCKCHGGSG